MHLRNEKRRIKDEEGKDEEEGRSRGPHRWDRIARTPPNLGRPLSPLIIRLRSRDVSHLPTALCAHTSTRSTFIHRYAASMMQRGIFVYKKEESRKIVISVIFSQIRPEIRRNNKKKKEKREIWNRYKSTYKKIRLQNFLERNQKFQKIHKNFIAFTWRFSNNDIHFDSYFQDKDIRQIRR